MIQSLGNFTLKTFHNIYNKIIKMKKPLNESFIRMQKIAGIVTENQINEEEFDEMGITIGLRDTNREQM